MKNIKLICMVCFVLLVSIQSVLYGEKQLIKYKFYEGPDLPVDKIAILRSGDENVSFEKCVVLEKIDDVDYKGSAKGFEIHLMPGTHRLTVSYSDGNDIGESIVIAFDAIAGKTYKVLGRPLTFHFSNQTGKMVYDTWKAWVEDANPDQETLAHRAKYDEDLLVRSAAVKKLTDQAVLADIAKNDKKDLIRMAAVERLTDQVLLADFAKNDENAVVRKFAVEKLIDQALLAEIAKNDKDEHVRKAAVEKLTDQAALAEVAKNDEDWHIREAAVDKLTDQAALAVIAKNDKEDLIRKAAKNRLKELKKK